jgi:hypothetical protein
MKPCVKVVSKPAFHFTAFILVLVMILGLAACASDSTVVESDMGINGSPKWVNEGTATLKTKDGRLFHGVGSSREVGDMSLQTSVADNRARAEIARILSSYMEIASRDYIASGKADQSQFTQQNVSREINNFTQLNMTGARIIGHWRDTKTNVVYSIAELDMDHVKTTLDKVKEMNPGFKGYLQSQGENIFDRISRREE